jgi:hypothetical protein
MNLWHDAIKNKDKRGKRNAPYGDVVNKAFSPSPRRFIATVLAYWWLSLASPVSIAETDVTLIANNSVELSELNTSSLRAIFSLRKRSWDNKIPVRVFVLPDSHPLHKKFCKKILKIYPYVLRDQWDRAIFSGAGNPPTVVKNIDELRRLIQATPGAIGYAPNTKPEAKDNMSHVSSENLAIPSPAYGAKS